jgi:dTMP kinase
MTNSHTPRPSSTASESDAAPRPPRDPNRNGWLFIFEGIDGAGKSIQLEAAAEWLEAKNLPVRRLHEPTAGPVGTQIRELAGSGRDSVTPEEEYRLFVEDRRWNVDNHILPSLASGEIILMDRYYISTIAYQGALGLDPVRIRRENEAFAPVPDRVFLLDLPPAHAHQRIRESRGDEPNLFERTEYLTKVARNFRRLRMPSLLRIDALLPPDAIQYVIRQDFIRLLDLPPEYRL